MKSVSKLVSTVGHEWQHRLQHLAGLYDGVYEGSEQWNINEANAHLWEVENVKLTGAGGMYRHNLRQVARYINAPFVSDINCSKYNLILENYGYYNY